MKWYKTWSFGFTLFCIIILLFAWIKGNLNEVIKTPLAIIVYFGLASIALAGFAEILIGTGRLIEKTIIKITNETNLISRFFEMVGKWLEYADKNRDKPHGIYNLFIGIILLIGSSMLMTYLLNDIKFLVD